MSSIESAKILLVEDSRSLARAYIEFLKPDGYEISHVEKGAEAILWLKNNQADAIVLDLMLPDMSGLDILQTLRQNDNDVEVLIITAHGSVDVAVSALRAGASDFLEKPFDSERLRTSIANILRKTQLAREVRTYRKEFKRDQYHGFTGSSLPMQAVYRIIESAAPSNAAIFITGESGTGKEVCADAIHRQSRRSSGPFVALNCAAIPKDLMESEVFGHIKGAFTGAHTERVGAATQAHGGTLFLDEICEMDLDLQSKLLRFIQTGTFQKVGSDKLEKVDIRIVCATNRSPLDEVESGNFREDLYYRLHVIPIHLPPLRDRDADVQKIAEYFLLRYSEEESKSFTGFDDDASQWFLNYSWPGNVRQLQNVLRNIVVLNDEPLVSATMLPVMPSVTKLVTQDNAEPVSNDSSPAGVASGASNVVVPLWKTEKKAIEHAIDQCEGNVPRAAALLEVSASTLYRKIQRWEE